MPYMIATAAPPAEAPARPKPKTRKNRTTKSLLGLGQLLAGAAKAPLSPAIGCDCGIQRSIVEIRPVGIGEIQFGISKLPEQKVGNAFFAAGTNEQIRFRCICHRQMRLQLLFGELRLARMSAD